MYRSIKAAQAAIPSSTVLRPTGFGSEVRVNFRKGVEATAYYTDDLDDAVETAKAMVEQAHRANRPIQQAEIGA